jgi:hypothetical protein
MPLNRTVVYISSLVQALGGLAIMSFASAAVNADPAIEQIWGMFEGPYIFIFLSYATSFCFSLFSLFLFINLFFSPEATAFVVTMIIVGILLILLAAVGLFGARSRDKPTLMFYYTALFLLVLVQLTYTGVIFDYFQPDQLVAFVPLLKQKWIDLAYQSQQSVNSVGTLRAQAFLTYVQGAGACCGFDDATMATVQNPVSLECNSTTTCQSSFLTEFRSTVEKQCIIIFAFATLEAVLLVAMCGLTCRYKPAPAFTKVKNGVGSVRRV